MGSQAKAAGWRLLPTDATLVQNGNNCSHDYHGVHFQRQCREVYVCVFANALKWFRPPSCDVM
jgi:hypothetical protein